MKRLPTLLLLTTIGLVPNAVAQNAQWLIGSEQPGSGRDLQNVHQAANGDIIALQDNVVVKFTEDGQALWANAYVLQITPDAPYVPAFTVFPDGSSALIAHTNFNSSPMPSIFEIVIIRVNSDGSVAWSQKFSLQMYNPIGTFILRPLSEGKLLLVGYGPMQARLIARISADGDLLGAEHQASNLVFLTEVQVHVSPEDEITLFFPDQPISYNEDIVIRLNSAGEQLWSKKVRLTNGPWEQWGITSNLAVDEDGNAYVFGETSAGTQHYPYLFKLNDVGDLVWYKIYGNGSNYINAQLPGRQISDGTLVFGTSSKNIFTTDGEHIDQAIVDFVDPAGTPDSIDWNRGSLSAVKDTLLFAGNRRREDPLFNYHWTWPFFYKATLGDLGPCLLEETDYAVYPDTTVPAAYVLVEDLPAFTPLITTQQDTAAFVVPYPLSTTQPLCDIASAVVGSDHAASLKIWPDPVAQGEFVNVGDVSNAQLEIFDAQGRSRYTARTNSTGTARIPTADLSAGVYLVRVKDHGSNVQRTLRMVVQ